MLSPLVLFWAAATAAPANPVVQARKNPLPDTALGVPIALSPSPGSHQHTAWIPLAFALPLRFVGGAVAVTLDGQPLDISGAAWGRGSTAEGKAARFIHTLELLDLDPGEHRILATVTALDGTVETLDIPFTVAPAPCRVSLSVVDATGTPRSARVSVFDEAGPVPLVGPDASTLDSMARDTALHSAFVIDGTGVVLLAPGRYRLVASAGIRDDVDVQELDINGDVDLKFTVPDVVPTPGWSTADLHVHTAHSADAYVPHDIRMYSLAAAGLDIAVITDHNDILDAEHLAESALGPHRAVRTVPGIEARLGAYGASWGHVNAFPVTTEAAPHSERSHDLAKLMTGWRARQRLHPHPIVGDTVLLQLNHPRGIQFAPDRAPIPKAHAVFTRMGFDPHRPLDDPMNAWLLHTHNGVRGADMDAIEVVNRFSWPLYRAGRADWFGLLNAGLRVTGTGNSDSHAAAVELAGFPVNLVQVAPPAPQAPMDVHAFVDAVSQGRLTVSTGPLVDLWVKPVGSRRVGAVGDTVSGRRVDVTVRVRAAPWVPVDEVRLVVNGRLSRLEALPQDTAVERATRTWRLDLEADTWIVAEAGWPITDERDHSPAVEGLYGLVAPGYVPIGFTNPVWVDADGDGAWTPPMAHGTPSPEN